MKLFETINKRNGWRFCLPFLILLTLLGGGACSKKSDGPTKEELQRRDSLTLRVALLPIDACAPLRYAHEMGIDDSLGVWLKIIPYNATMDIDTAVLAQRADVYILDSVRVHRIMTDSVRPQLLMPLTVDMALVANRGKRIRKAISLKEHMVGTTRWSIVDNWLECIVDSKRLKSQDVFHAQINNIPLRYRMVRDGLLDAGILPEPYVDSLRVHGHRIITEKRLHGLGLYTDARLNKDTALMSRAKMIIEIYSEAVCRMKMK